MTRVKSANTKPEMLVRRLVHAMGYRYRLRPKDIKGKPDLVFRSRKKAIFVHGCFWHQHECQRYRMPKTRLEFWLPKLGANVLRDVRVLNYLAEAGWKTLVIWECEISDQDRLRARIEAFLGEAVQELSE